MLTNLYVLDKYFNEIHRIGADTHDSLSIRDGKLFYYNLQNGDGGFVADEASCGYVILWSEDGSLTDECGEVIDKRFEKEIREWIE